MYRDELSAAQARIEALERELAETRARLDAYENPRPAHEDLVRARVTAKSEFDAARQSRFGSAIITAILGVFGTATFTLAISALGDSGHPFNAFLLGACMTFLGLLLVAAFHGGRVRRAAEALADAERALDTEVASIRVRVAHDGGAQTQTEEHHERGARVDANAARRGRR